MRLHILDQLWEDGLEFFQGGRHDEEI
jgi:hypothetical protein